MNRGPDMSVQASTQPRWRRIAQSVVAVMAGLIAIIVLSLASDQVFHTLGVYPPWGEPMHEPGLNLLALSYRILFGVMGGFVAALLAPHHPMRHALALGVVGLVLSTAGAAGAIAAEMGPVWFPVALVLIAVPCAWVGGLLHRQWRGQS